MVFNRQLSCTNLGEPLSRARAHGAARARAGSLRRHARAVARRPRCCLFALAHRARCVRWAGGGARARERRGACDATSGRVGLEGDSVFVTESLGVRAESVTSKKSLRTAQQLCMHAHCLSLTNTQTRTNTRTHTYTCTHTHTHTHRGTHTHSHPIFFKFFKFFILSNKQHHLLDSLNDPFFTLFKKIHLL